MRCIHGILTVIKLLKKRSFFRESSGNMIRWRYRRYFVSFSHLNVVALRYSRIRWCVLERLSELLRFHDLRSVRFRIFVRFPGRINIIRDRRWPGKIFRCWITNTFSFPYLRAHFFSDNRAISFIVGFVGFEAFGLLIVSTVVVVILFVMMVGSRGRYVWRVL